MTKEFGDYFSEYMQKAGFKSKKGLSRRTGINRATIQYVIMGDINLTPEVSKIFADAFCVFERDERIRFHLLSAGFSGEYIDAVLGRSSTESLIIKKPVKR